ncbi:H-NS histone family protein [Leisingera sp. SS27]|uniref:H-NS histone family protein n=1 Tax=Leisingera sp. SS27 TaxID=2979462 RepID=UPI00232C70AF|nr:H-NS histone family protein [Leisingera sp. SS27]MDC0660585.1 H-NS histone family protein [Leisingera sp. SS27]
MDLKAMSSAELKQLQAELANAIDVRQKEDLRAAHLAAEKAVGEFGFSLEDVFTSAVKRPKGKAVPKYRNPGNPDQTWTGRGRKPKWINEVLQGGADLTDLEIT